jgi:hypothetical protein
MTIRTFIPFNRDEDIVVANQTTVTTGLWSGDTGSLGSTIYSSPTQISSSGDYYFDIYNKNPVTDSTAEVQFAVAYGHVGGGGSPTLNQQELSKVCTETTYLQYKNILLDPSDDLFTFEGYSPRHIYVVNIARSRLREQLDPGNWSVLMSGSNGRFEFIDDSGQTLSAKSATGKSGRVFNVVSGSLTGASGSTVFSSASTSAGGFGLVYPDLGIIVLNPDAMKQTVGFSAAAQDTYYSTPNAVFAPFTGSLTNNGGLGNEQRNHAALFNSIKLGGDFQARSAETISSTHYFVRLRNKDFNYSNNPSFYNNTNGQILNEDFVQDPHVYATTIGLYNDNNELLAVAKMSQPLEKTFDKEALVRIRLDFVFLATLLGNAALLLGGLLSSGAWIV